MVDMFGNKAHVGNYAVFVYKRGYSNTRTSLELGIIKKICKKTVLIAVCNKLTGKEITSPSPTVYKSYDLTKYVPSDKFALMIEEHVK